MQARRLILTAPIAGLATLGLFMMMMALIRIEHAPPAPVRELPRIVLSDIPPDAEPCRRCVTDLPEAPTAPPPIPISTVDIVTPTDAPPFPEVQPPTTDRGDIRIPTPDMRMTATIEVPPAFPPRLATRGIEGDCAVTYDISPEGRPINIRAGACAHADFAAASIAAIAQWRYPASNDGSTAYNRHKLFNFRLEN